MGDSSGPDFAYAAITSTALAVVKPGQLLYLKWKIEVGRTRATTYIGTASWRAIADCHAVTARQV